MAPIKFEEDIKEKLENRSLQPSPKSWSALASRLDADEKKSKTSMFWWLSIAASVVIMIAVSVRFFTTTSTNIPAQQIVIEEENKQDNLNITKDSNTKNNTISNSIVVNTEAKSIKTTNNLTQKTEEKTIKNHQQIATNTTVKKVSNTIDKTIINTDKVENLSTTSIKSDTEVAQIIEDIKNETNININKEVDSLLTLAQKELTKNKLQKHTPKTVDANQLLEEVEEDMGQSFRSKVFEALTESYKAVKTAVVERNN